MPRSCLFFHRNDLEYTLRTNVSSVHSVTQSFLPLLQKGSLRKIINMSVFKSPSPLLKEGRAHQTSSSGLGSIALAGKYKAEPFPAYNVSKAALNMLTVQYSLSLNDDGFTVIAVSPGVGFLPMPWRAVLTCGSGSAPIWEVQTPILRWKLVPEQYSNSSPVSNAKITASFSTSACQISLILKGPRDILEVKFHGRA